MDSIWAILRHFQKHKSDLLCRKQAQQTQLNGHYGTLWFADLGSRKFSNLSWCLEIRLSARWLENGEPAKSECLDADVDRELHPCGSTQACEISNDAFEKLTKHLSLISLLDVSTKLP